MGRSNKKKHKQKGRRRRDAESGSEKRKVKPPSSGGEGDERQAVYGRYKEATRSFRDGLASLLPESVPLTSVADLGNAVEYLHLESSKSGDKVAPPAVGIGLLSSLNISIKLREEFSASIGGDSDEGHKYMNGMLRYCRDVLRKCRKMYLTSALPRTKSKPSNVDTDRGNLDVLGQRFGALSMHGEGEEEESEEDGHDCAPAVRPSDPEREYSIEKDLIEGDDSMHARLYLFQMKAYMDLIDYHFRNLQAKMEFLIKNTSDIIESDVNSVIVGYVMNCSACVNLALEEMQYFEEALTAESPHLKTFYHVVAILVFPAMINQLEDSISPNILSSNPHMVLDFLAKEVEYGFRTLACPGFAKSDHRAITFAKRAKIPDLLPIAFSRLAISLTLLEVGPDCVIEHEDAQEVVGPCRRMVDMHRQEHGDESEMWEVLGLGRKRISKGAEGERKIEYVRDVLHTQSLLQCQVHYLPAPSDERYMKFNPDQWICTPQHCRWDENFNKAEGIDDPRMDDFFLRTFLPLFFNKCHAPKCQEMFNAFFQDLLPRFFPLFQNFLSYFKRRNTTVPFSTTLSVHAMLTGILHLQGYIKRIALAARSASEKYYEQIQWVIDQHGSLNNVEGVQGLLKSMKSQENAFRPVFGSDFPEDMQLLAFWNPMVAGCFLSNVLYLNNIWYGARLLDRKNQLISMLHLFHALKARKILQDDDIPLLSQMDSIFAECKAIWGDGKPSNDFCKNFFVASGVALHASKTMAVFIKDIPVKVIRDTNENASEEKRAKLEDFLRRQFTMEKDIFVSRLEVLLAMRGALVRGRRHELRQLKPEDISVSYQCMAKRDFSGIAESCCPGNSVSSLESSGVATTLMNHFRRQEALQKKILEDSVRRSLSVNYVKLSWVLDDALNQLACHMGWSELINKSCRGFMAQWKRTEGDKHFYAINSLLGDWIFGELDYEKDGAKCTESKRCAEFLNTYFGAVHKEDIHFY
ncbi:hypothetical protein ACHAWF_009859 [Thalassiosira exigua]